MSTFDESNVRRQPAGVTGAGQFASKPRGEADVSVHMVAPSNDVEKAAFDSVHEWVMRHVNDAVWWEAEMERADGSWDREYSGYVTVVRGDGRRVVLDLHQTPAFDALSDWEHDQREAYGDTEALEAVSWSAS